MPCGPHISNHSGVTEKEKPWWRFYAKDVGILPFPGYPAGASGLPSGRWKEKGKERRLSCKSSPSFSVCLNFSVKSTIERILLLNFML